MECEQLTRVLHPYLDGELDPAAAAEAAAHCAGCPACATVIARQRALGRELAALIPQQAPAALRQRIARRLAAAGPDLLRPAAPGAARPRHRPPLRLAAALAAALLLGWLLAWGRYHEGADDALVRQLVALHQRALLPGHLTDIESSDHHAVKPWFNGRLDYAPWVDDLKRVGFPLSGGRVEILDGRRVAVLVFRRRDHVIDLVVNPLGLGDEPLFAMTTNEGYQIQTWTIKGQYLAAISDLNADELAQFAAAVRAATP